MHEQVINKSFGDSEPAHALFRSEFTLTDGWKPLVLHGFDLFPYLGDLLPGEPGVRRDLRIGPVLLQFVEYSVQIVVGDAHLGLSLIHISEPTRP